MGESDGKGVARRVAEAVRRTPLRRALNHWPANVIRGRLNRSSASDVLEAVAALDRAGVPAWLAGGWGMDALLGRETRWHGDIDFVVPCDADIPARAVTAIRDQGYEVVAEEQVPSGLFRSRVLLRNSAGRLVDIHPLTFDDPATATATGLLAGEVVACISAQLALAAHEGYRIKHRHRHDVATLTRLAR